VLKAKADTRVLPWCTFTSPEVGRVGLSETEAKKAGVPHDVWIQPLAELDRAVVESEAQGFAKVITEKGSDRILGAAIVAERGGDLVHEIVVAMRAGLGLKDLSATIHAYPTYAEIARRAADRYQKSRLTPRSQGPLRVAVSPSRARMTRTERGRKAVPRSAGSFWAVVAVALRGHARPARRASGCAASSPWVAPQGIWGGVIYGIVYTVAVLLFVPGSVLTIGPASFRPRVGTVIVSIGVHRPPPPWPS
jgi:hypothetical protein